MSNCRCSCQKPEPSEALDEANKKIKSLENKLLRRDKKIQELESEVRKQEERAEAGRDLVESALELAYAFGYQLGDYYAP
jgi:septal ring factor EnvC (AmiA/AmiB activator)